MNLDATINKVGFEIANLLDKNDIEKLLGVLAQDGVYAMWVYALNKITWNYSPDCQQYKNSDLYKFLEQLDKFPIQINKKIIDTKRDREICKLTFLIKNKVPTKIKNIIENNEINKNIKNNKIKTQQKVLKKLVECRESKLNEFFLELSKDLNQLLFFKELLEKALIYARYHAKAMSDE